MTSSFYLHFIINFNPRAPYGARLIGEITEFFINIISIHAPHTGRDVVEGISGCMHYRISIHAPHTGRDCDWTGRC